MFVSLKWLNQYVKVDDLDPEELAQRITNAGIEVESVRRLSTATGCVIGYVEEVYPHPEADKLRVCRVDIGDDEPKQIVCGAPNVRSGQKVIVAKVGAVLPGNVKIRKATLRGVESHGMICSLQELGIESKFVPEAYQNGIYVLEEDAPIGEDAIRYLGLDDTILEFSLTPNRSDCLSMLGVAYEVGAILDREVKLPMDYNDLYTEDPSFPVTIDSPKCELYYAKKVRGVKIGPSPLWMQQALIASNVRPINNVVDITNYVMLELGQPLHAFDLNKLDHQRIVVRQAKKGEILVTLDEVERKLEETDLVITDGEKPIALAGVMGGLDTAIDAETTDVLLESAVFDPYTIRQTSTRLDLRSESSIRFEKRVDPGRTLYALQRASQLMVKLCGGTIDNRLSVDGITERLQNTIELSVDKVKKVLGIEIPVSAIADIFRRLQFTFTVYDNSFHVVIPSRRPDLLIEEDLIEEIIRIYGYEHLKETLPLTETVGGLTPVQKMRRIIVDTMLSCGLTEVVTYSLLGEKDVERFKMHEEDRFEPIVLKMPMSEDRKILRHSLLHHLLSVIQYNQARNMDNIHIFELGRRYKWTPEGPAEEEILAGALTGLIMENAWQKKQEAVDFYYVKGILEALFQRLRIAHQIAFVPANDGLGKDFHPGRTAYILLNDTRIGIVAQVHPATQNEYELDETYVFEIVLDLIFHFGQPRKQVYEKISRYPGMARDLAIIVDENRLASDLQRTILAHGGPILKSAVVFDVYSGGTIPTGKKSVAFSLYFEDPERTLTDEEVTQVMERILNALEKTYQATLRQ